MNKFKFNNEEYLKRINLRIDIEPTKECLKQIHRAQHRAIPFENFDIILGRKINLSIDTIFKKLVKSNRGGYCFELNKLLLSALHYNGFESRALLGRVHVTGKATGRGHLISLVTIKKKQWVVDAGFGSDTPSEPIPLILEDKIITSSGQEIMLIKDKLYGIMLQVRKNNEWCNLYSFDLGHVCDGDIDYGNYFTSTHPSSIFVFARVAALPLENGMVTLFNNRIKKHVNGKTFEIELNEGEDYLKAIKKFFNIELDASYSDLKPIE